MTEEQREIRRKKRVIEYAKANGDVDRDVCADSSDCHPFLLVQLYSRGSMHGGEGRRAGCALSPMDLGRENRCFRS